MAAIMGIDDEIVVDACTEAAGDQIVAAVNFNAPGQVVIAGDAAAVARAINICKKAGAKRAVELPVSAPFHTSLMRPAADNLAELVQQTTFSRHRYRSCTMFTLSRKAIPRRLKP